MQKRKIALIVAGCALLLAVSWLAAVFSKSDADRQEALIEAAQAYMDDEIYIKAVPLLEEAAGYNDKYTLSAEETLKSCYLSLMKLGQSGFGRKYTNLLDLQMAGENAAPEIYKEAAEYYFGASKEDKAFEALRSGISKTGDQGLIDFYESNRYVYWTGRGTYQEVTDFLNGAIQVCQEGKWGLADAAGNLVLPCEYLYLSPYSEGKVITTDGRKLISIDLNGNRLALYKGEPQKEIRGFNEDRLAVKLAEGWVLATGEMAVGGSEFEDIGIFSDGGAAAEVNGKWGVIDRSGQEWIIDPVYDGVVCDDLGRCMCGNTVFVREKGEVLLLVDGQPAGEKYEDARPFAGGWAAVQKNGKWGYIDQTGEQKIDFRFDDARSFTMHLAAVKVGDMWGYVGLNGNIVIEPDFVEAKAFADGTAPVKTADGWQFITLAEYGGAGMGF